MNESVTSIPPELAKAIVEAQRAADVLERDGLGDKGKYTTGDAIAAETRRVLNLNGAAWVLLGTKLESSGLATADIGQQSYVGDILEEWAIVHEGGAMLCGTGRMPVVVSRGRPHDKAVGASLTYGTGQVLRGAMCFVREDKNAIDRRADDSPPDVQDAASAQACRTRVERIAELSGKPPGEVWRGLCKRLTLEPMQDGGPPTADDLTVNEGKIVLAALDAEIKRIEGESGPGQRGGKSEAKCTGEGQPIADACRERISELAKLLGESKPGRLWAHWCGKANIPNGPDGNPPTAEQLTVSQGRTLKDLLASAIEHHKADRTRSAPAEREPGDDGDELDHGEVPEDDARALADAERRVGGAFPGTRRGSRAKPGEVAPA